MGLWNFYFLAKLYWFERGLINLDVLLNVFFLIFLLVSVPKQWRFSKTLTSLKLVIAPLLGLILLWHDSWLPSVNRTVYFLIEEGLPSKEFLFRFLSEFFVLNLFESLILILLFALCFLAVRREISLTPFVVIFLFIVPIQEMNQPKGEMDQSITQFYQSELKRTIHFDQRRLEAEDFDIIFLHVCSLSWDDLKKIGLEKDPFFQQFDLLFTQFNTVTAYSTPSAIRLLKGSCGQMTHQKLYQDSSPDCYIADNLKREGYESYFALNHDGVYGHFSDDLQNFGHLTPPLKPGNVPIQAYNFDGSPIYDDEAVLEQVWKNRQESKNPRSFIYYNTISLHDGAVRKGDPEWSKKDRNHRYRFFLKKLFQDVTTFIQRVESSGKNSIIVFIPEHGMALRASAIQPAGLREIPLPQITIVPAGIKFVRKDHRQILPSQQLISKPVSYLSLSFLLSSFMKENPFQFQTPALETLRWSNPRVIDWSVRIPETDFVSENEETRVIKIGPDYFSLTKGKQWIKLSS